ncbi:ImmA/IrrE family metallo-endopeptidase [Chloroflexota bacterium]
MTLVKIHKWESELWSYMSSGDGVNCPVYDDCKTRQHGGWCFSDNKEMFTGLYGTHVKGSSGGETELYAFRSLFEYNFPRKWICGRIFQLVEALANKYIKQSKLNHPPVITELIKQLDISPSIEIRTLPLKASHGAIWHLEDGWVIHLNAEDKPAAQRVTLFHEVFHILAHSRATPVFRKRGIKEGSFNEMLADYFAGCILMPKEWVKEKWKEVNDLKRIAEIFQVTEVSMWVRLKLMGLIW